MGKNIFINIDICLRVCNVIHITRIAEDIYSTRCPINIQEQHQVHSSNPAQRTFPFRNSSSSKGTLGINIHHWSTYIIGNYLYYNYESQNKIIFFI